MKAVVRIAGVQMAVKEKDVLRVPRLGATEGTSVRFEDVLLVTAGDKTTVGQPTVKGASVSAEIVRHLRGPKIEVATFKRRKDFRKHVGHRSEYTEIRITGISAA